MAKPKKGGASNFSRTSDRRQRLRQGRRVVSHSYGKPATARSSTTLQASPRKPPSSNGGWHQPGSRSVCTRLQPISPDTMFACSTKALHGGVCGRGLFDVPARSIWLIGRGADRNGRWIQKISRDNAERGYSGPRRSSIYDPAPQCLLTFKFTFCRRRDQPATDINFQRCAPTGDSLQNRCRFVPQNIRPPRWKSVCVDHSLSAKEAGEKVGIIVCLICCA